MKSWTILSPYTGKRLSKHDTVRAQRAIAPKFPTLSADLSGGSVNLIPFYSYFPVFDTRTRVTRRMAKKIPFYSFLFMRMMYRPQWDMLPGLKPIVGVWYWWIWMNFYQPIQIRIILTPEISRKHPTSLK